MKKRIMLTIAMIMALNNMQVFISDESLPGYDSNMAVNDFYFLESNNGQGDSAGYYCDGDKCYYRGSK